MRRRRSNALRRRSASASVRAGLVIAAQVVLLARAARGQSGATGEGGTDLLFPVGARSIGMGQAVAAAATGVDALWWNPALVARSGREVGFHIAKVLFLDTDAGASVIVPVQHAFTLGFTLRYIDEGQQDATQKDPNAPQGVFDISSVVASGTFAAPFGDRFAAGVSAKILRVDFACTGACGINAPPGAPTTQAFDAGVQYFVTKDSMVSIGAVVRDVGFKLQINDSPQADPLPSRFDLGVQYIPKFAQIPPDQRLRFAADVVTRLEGGGDPGINLGGEWSWQERVEARIGYMHNGPLGSGTTLGVGLAAGQWQVDVARVLLNVDAGTGPPTYITLRYHF